MTIAALSATSPQGTGNTNGGKSTTGKPAADYQTFLTLLTTQLKNQDPLKPLESTAFVAQLASFSAVEQQVQTNDNLKSIKSLLGGASVSALAPWIGKDVRAAHDVHFSGVPVELIVSPAQGSDRADLVVRNPAGTEVQRQPITGDTSNLNWAGVSDNGTPFANGTYQFSIESFRGSERVDQSPADIYDAVVEARIDNGKPMLVLRDGTVLSPDIVTAIRNQSP